MTDGEPLPGVLCGAHVLIIGGSGGIGGAAARMLLSLGARVTLAARSTDRLIRAADQMVADARAASRPQTVAIDANDLPGLRAAIAQLEPLDHVLFAAATSARGPLVDTPAADLRSAVESRIYAVYEVGRILAQRTARSGSLTLVSGTLGERPIPGFAMIAAAVGGAESLARALALELAPLRVNVLRPGYTDTEGFRAALGADSDAAVEEIGRRVPLGRVGRPEEVAAGALACMSNPYMTGSIIQVDGGLSLAG